MAQVAEAGDRPRDALYFIRSHELHRVAAWRNRNVQAKAPDEPGRGSIRSCCAVLVMPLTWL